MIDTKELRRLAQAATPGPWASQGRYIGTPRHMSYVGEVRDQCGNWSDTEKSRADAAFIAAANPAAISELLDRLEAAERERDEFKRACFGHISDNSMLRAKVEAMERQEPVAWIRGRDDYRRRKLSFEKPAKSSPDKFHWSPLYLTPGAQPAPSIPEGWRLVPIEPTPGMKTAGIGVEVYQDSPPSTDCLTWEEVEAIYKAMLAAAPGVKK